MRDYGSSRWYKPSMKWRYLVRVDCDKTPRGVKAQTVGLRFLHADRGDVGTVQLTRSGDKIDFAPLLALPNIPETVKKDARARANAEIRSLEYMFYRTAP